MFRKLMPLSYFFPVHTNVSLNYLLQLYVNTHWWELSQKFPAILISLSSNTFA